MIRYVTIYILTFQVFTHWGRVTHICVSKLTITGSPNGMSPRRRQSIIWTNAGILLIGPLGTNLSEILSEIWTFSFKKKHLKTSSAKWRPFCLGLNVLIHKATISRDVKSCISDNWATTIQTDINQTNNIIISQGKLWLLDQDGLWPT